MAWCSVMKPRIEPLKTRPQNRQALMMLQAVNIAKGWAGEQYSGWASAARVAAWLPGGNAEVQAQGSALLAAAEM